MRSMRRLLSLRLAYRHVRSTLGRMALSIVAVALGVALVVAIRLMNAAVLESFLDTLEATAGRANLTISAGEGITFSEDVVESVARAPGVKLAVPLVTSVAFPDDDSGELLTVHGVDLTNDAAVRLYHEAGSADEVIDDLTVFLSQPDSIVVGSELAARRGLRVGSPLDLVTPKGVRRFTVRGLLEPQGLARTLGGRLIIMDLFAAERAFTGDRQINQVDVVLADGHGVEATKGALAAVVPAGLRVEEPSVRRDVVRKTVAAFQMMLTAFGLLAVLAGFVICYSRLGAIYEARTWEVGLLRAVGLRRVVVFVELLKESLVVGGVGTAIGIALGVILGRYALPLVATATALNYNLPVPSAEPGLQPVALIFGAIVGVGASVLAATAPAIRIARKQPVAALTLRGREASDASLGARWILPLSLVFAALALIAWQIAIDSPALGIATTAVLAVAACMLARPMLGVGGRAVGAVLERTFGRVGRFAAEGLGRQAQRASLTVATLGVGLGAVLMFGMLGWSFERTLVTQLASRLKSDLAVTSPFVSGGWMVAPLDGSIVERIRSIPGVQEASGEQQREIPYRDNVALLDGYDPVSFHNPRVTTFPLETGALPGALESVARGEAVLVSSAFARRFGAAPGDTVSVSSPQGLQTFAVVGVTPSEPTVGIIMSRDRYRQSWNDSLVRWVHVAVRPGNDPKVVAGAIRSQIGKEYRVHVRPTAQLIEYFAHQVRRAFSLAYVLEAIIFLLIMIALSDTLATAVVERTRELGMMRAVGLRRSRLFLLVVLEAVAIGALGLVLAAATGLVLGGFWVTVQFPALLGWRLDVHFPSGFAVVACVLTVLLCIAASVPPSIRAVRLSIPEALRHE